MNKPRTGDDDTIIIGSGGRRRNNEVDTTSPIEADILAMEDSVAGWKTFIQGDSNDGPSKTECDKILNHLEKLRQRSTTYAFLP